MKLCSHYVFDKDTNKYVSLVEKDCPKNGNPNRVHTYHCKRCGMKMHDIDDWNLNNKIKNMNKKLSGDYPLIDKSDIFDMLAPVPGTYHEDSKYRDNQQS